MPQNMDASAAAGGHHDAEAWKAKVEVTVVAVGQQATPMGTLRTSIHCRVVATGIVYALTTDMPPHPDVQVGTTLWLDGWSYLYRAPVAR